MKNILMAAALLLHLSSATAQWPDFNKYPVYNKGDLGLVYSPKASAFTVYAPDAQQVQLLLYKEGAGGNSIATYDLVKTAGGAFTLKVTGNLEGQFYTFRTRINDKWMEEVPDPYAKAVGINGKLAMVVNMNNTHPPGWQNDKAPSFKNKTDAVIYELHVRDASIAASSGISKKGKYTGLTETNTKNAAGLSTGLDHLKELGVTHIHLLPVFDFHSIDETKPDSRYNWGYDPLNYNVPEGSYATNATDGITRIREFKQLVQTLHANGLRVVMDVVYNHTSVTEASNFNQLAPGYYYRQNDKGGFSNASACGNETASERPMMRKFILESMMYWVKEYHIDGFRVDLMGIHDIETMNLISKELHKIKPDILLYGEGWTAGASPLPDSLRALKANAYKLERIAVFSDDLRDGIKGSVFENADKGFASGKPGLEESVKFGITAACPHPQVEYSKVNYAKAPYARQPYHFISYCECHDNHVLWDKLALSAPSATEAERISMHKLSLSIVLTSQGISFLHSGTEFLRSKKGVENSFESPDSINAIDWNLKTKNKDVFDYVKALIAMRKAHPAFRMTSAANIAKHLTFVQQLPPGVIGYTLNGKAVKDKWQTIRVYFNGTGKEQQVSLDSKYYMTAIVNNTFVTPVNVLSSLTLAPYSCTVLYKE